MWGESGLSIERDDPKSFVRVVLPGFEPGLREPKPLVLPLHHSTILKAICDQWIGQIAGAKVRLLFDSAKVFVDFFVFCFVHLNISANFAGDLCMNQLKWLKKDS